MSEFNIDHMIMEVASVTTRTVAEKLARTLRSNSRKEFATNSPGGTADSWNFEKAGKTDYSVYNIGEHSRLSYQGRKGFSAKDGGVIAFPKGQLVNYRASWVDYRKRTTNPIYTKHRSQDEDMVFTKKVGAYIPSEEVRNLIDNTIMEVLNGIK